MANTWTRQARQLASLLDPRPGCSLMYWISVWSLQNIPVANLCCSKLYVWGRTRTLQTLLSAVDGFQKRNAFLVEENASQIPSTIKDAMYVTNLLGEVCNCTFIPQHAVVQAYRCHFHSKIKRPLRVMYPFVLLRTNRITDIIQAISMGWFLMHYSRRRCNQDVLFEQHCLHLRSRYRHHHRSSVRSVWPLILWLCGNQATATLLGILLRARLLAPLTSIGSNTNIHIEETMPNAGFADLQNMEQSYEKRTRKSLL